MTPRRAMRALVQLIAVSFLASAISVEGQQQHFDPFNNVDSTTNSPKGYITHSGSTLFITVYSESTKTRLDRQCIVKVTNQSLQNISWQTTNGESEASFGDVPFGHYDAEVNAVGYLTAHKEFQVVSPTIPIKLEIVLQKDPAAVDLKVSAEALPAKARKDTKHGVSALKSGKWDEANKRLDAAYKIAPSNADINFLLGYVYYQKKQFGKASDYLGTATNINPRNVQALTLLG